MNIGFYILGKKGYLSLIKFVKVFGAARVSFVVSSKDPGVDKDWNEEIISFCCAEKIKYIGKDEKKLFYSEPGYSFAIGWRWMINDHERLIVFHDSLLPRYRGFSPLVNMLINGENEIGVTALLASHEYDKGEIIYQTKRKINYPLKISQAIDMIIPLYVKLVLKIGADIFYRGNINSTPQDENLASYSLWRDEADYFIDWNMSSEEILRFVDALGSPYKGAATMLRGNVARVLEVEPVDDVNVEGRDKCVGKCIFRQNGCPVVVCGKGLIKIVKAVSEKGDDIVRNIPFRSRFEGA